MDRHRLDADPDPTFHFDADSGPDPTPNFTHVGKLEIFLDFIAIRVSIVFIFLLSVSGAVILKHLDNISKFSGKK